MAGIFRSTAFGNYDANKAADLFVMKGDQLVRIADLFDGKSNFQIIQNGGGTFVVKADNLSATIFDSTGQPLTTQSGVFLSFAGLDSAAELQGSERNDVIGGGNGNDRLFGFEGDDLFIGSLGRDKIDGGDGLDTVDYSGSLAGVTAALDRADTAGQIALSLIEIAIGSKFSDTLSASDKTVRLEGGDGDDTLEAAEMATTEERSFHGGNGTDTVSYAGSKTGVTVDLTNSSNNVGVAYLDRYRSIENIVGSQGRDELIGDGSENVLEGGGLGDVLDGGNGTDTASYQHSKGPVAVNLSLGASRQPGGFDCFGDRLINIENLTGSSYEDQLTGDGNDNVLDGGAGDDVMHGGNGDDLYILNSSGDIVDETDSLGTDTVQSGVISLKLTGDAFAGRIENATLTGSNNLNLQGNFLANTLTGNDGSNQIDGGAGDDILKGGAGNDFLSGGDGSDRLYGGADFDTALFFNDPITANFITGTVLTGNGDVDTLVSIEKIVGTSKSDTFIMSVGADNADGGGSSDTLDYSRSNAAVNVNLATNAVSGGYAQGDTIRSFESVVGSGFADKLTGNNGANRLNGGLGADTMTGGLGSDTYIVDNARDVVVEKAGQGTADRIASSVSYTLKAGVEVEQLLTTSSSGTSAINFTGNEFAQLIRGNAGANRIDGKGGADTLTGGGGNDSFIFSTALGSGNVDVITDFSNATGNNDTIRLTKSIFAVLTGDANTMLTGDQFVANAAGAATNASQHIIYETDTGKLFYDADGNGSGAAVQFAQLGTTASHPGGITAGDFLLI